MTSESIKALEKHRPVYNMLMQDFELKISAEAKREILDIIRKEINPDYTVLMWCGTCVADMVKIAFRAADATPKKVTKEKIRFK